MAVAFLLLASPACAEEVTVLALGDSLTQGFGLSQTDGFVPQLQGWLDTQDIDARVINAGVSGDTTAGGAARVAWSLTPDVDAMIVALGGNDLLRGIDPAVSRANLAKILQVAQAEEVRVLLIGLRAPGNYGPDFKAEFDAIYPGLSTEFGVPYVASFFHGLEDKGDLGNATAFFQSDGIHPNATGVTRIVEGLGPAVIELIRTARGELRDEVPQNTAN